MVIVGRGFSRKSEVRSRKTESRNVEGGMRKSGSLEVGKGEEKGGFVPLKIRGFVHEFHATDFVNTSFTVFYKNKLPKIDPFMVTECCHH